MYLIPSPGAPVGGALGLPQAEASGTFVKLLTLVSGPRKGMIDDQEAYGFCLALGGHDPGRTEGSSFVSPTTWHTPSSHLGQNVIPETHALLADKEAEDKHSRSFAQSPTAGRKLLEFNPRFF